MSDTFEILSRHVIATLPGEVGSRRAVLNALLVHTPAGHDRQSEIRTMLGNLDQHLVMQREFALSQEGSNPSASA